MHQILPSLTSENPLETVYERIGYRFIKNYTLILLEKKDSCKYALVASRARLLEGKLERLIGA